MQIFCNLEMDIRHLSELILIRMNSASHNESFQEICVKALRRGGARVTHARIAVIEALAEASRPMTAKDVMEKVRSLSSQETVDLVSVYRTLEKLSRLELVHRVSPNGQFLPCKHTACGHERHVMMRCRSCARVTECDVNKVNVAPLLSFLEEQHGFRADGKTLQIDGVCEGCQ